MLLREPPRRLRLKPQPPKEEPMPRKKGKKKVAPKKEEPRLLPEPENHPLNDVIALIQAEREGHQEKASKAHETRLREDAEVIRCDRALRYLKIQLPKKPEPKPEPAAGAKGEPCQFSETVLGTVLCKADPDTAVSCPCATDQGRCKINKAGKRPNKDKPAEAPKTLQ